MKPKQFQWCDRALILAPYYCLCTTEAQFHAQMAALDVPRDQWGAWVSEGKNGKCHHLVKQDGERCAIVCMDGWHGKDPLEVAGLLIHEAVHIWQATKDRMGETEAGSEVEAYAIQVIAQELMWSFREQMKK